MKNKLIVAIMSLIMTASLFCPTSCYAAEKYELISKQVVSLDHFTLHPKGTKIYNDQAFSDFHYSVVSAIEEELEKARIKAEKEKKRKEREEAKRKAREEQKRLEASRVYMGNYEITFYCGCAYCCGSAGNRTASGTWPTQGRTISADTSQLPFGTRVYIEGWGEYVVEDTGSAIHGNIIDVYMNDHNTCLRYGRQHKDVYVLK